MVDSLTPVVLLHRPGLFGQGGALYADLDVVNTTEEKVGRIMIMVFGRQVMLRGYYFGVETFQESLQMEADAARTTVRLGDLMDRFLRGHNLLWIRSPEELDEPE